MLCPLSQHDRGQAVIAVLIILRPGSDPTSTRLAYHLPRYRALISLQNGITLLNRYLLPHEISYARAVGLTSRALVYKPTSGIPLLDQGS